MIEFDLEVLRGRFRCCHLLAPEDRGGRGKVQTPVSAASEGQWGYEVPPAHLAPHFCDSSFPPAQLASKKSLWESLCGPITARILDTNLGLHPILNPQPSQKSEAKL